VPSRDAPVAGVKDILQKSSRDLGQTRAAADWLVSAWDQNAALRQVTPAHAAVEDIASAWLLDLLGPPANVGVGSASR
jgi:glutamate/tyrosine decarboxylase-like PLP-dependent enzyme